MELREPQSSWYPEAQPEREGAGGRGGTLAVGERGGWENMPNPTAVLRARQLAGWRSEPFGDTEAAQVVEESITGKPNKHRAAARMSLNSGNL